MQAGWHLNVQPGWAEHTFFVEACRVDGADCVRLAYPVSGFAYRNPPVPRELLECLMRRNDRLFARGQDQDRQRQQQKSKERDTGRDR